MRKHRLITSPTMKKTFPVFALLRSQLTPFSTVYVGYSFPLGSTSGGENAIKINEGGVIWGLNAGVRYAFNRNLAVNAYVGYMGMHLETP